MTFISCVKKKMIMRTTNEYTKEELIIIEFATRLETKDKKYEDYHKPVKSNFQKKGPI